MSNFAFLADDFPALHDAAVSAERLASRDRAEPTLAVISCGRACEIAVKWAFANDPDLTPPYQDNISTLIHDPAFRRIADGKVFEKLKYINRIRNMAAHEAKTVKLEAAQGVVQELFHVAYWFGRMYGRKAKPEADARFDAGVFSGVTSKLHEGLRTALEIAKKQEAAIAERDRALADLRSGKAALDDELQQLRKQVALARANAETHSDPHDYNEAETRDRFIDLLLREAGWTDFQQGRDVEYRVTPMPNAEGEGFADYVLWGADGQPLGVVEAKRTRHDARKGQQQAKLYADALETMHGRRPVIFYTNGYEHWIWDDAGGADGNGRPPRRLGGFYKRDELELMVQRRGTAKRLSTISPDTAVAGRPYQLKAIGSIAQDFDAGRNKALLVMATGTGKTRTVVALVDAMMKAGLVKRALFLADRVSLVKQAVGAFKEHLPASNPVNLVTDRLGQGRIYVSTYPTMMGLIDGKAKKGGDERSFGPGHFDLVIIDEAHRSVYQRYRAIFDYFDSYLVGLTATPREEVDRDTYELFDLETGVPTDSYDLETAILERHLVPPEPMAVATKFLRGGIRYDDLSDEEKERWDMLEWDDGDVPDEVSAAELNKFLFNTDTVDKVLSHLMTNGIHVKGGDQLGKTIIFAKNQKHAEFIEERFNANWPHFGGQFARIITHKADYAQSLIDDFSIADKAPHIAISVDMLDTGIDVPEVVNLVFFKLVRSKTKFWQMVGRGTRLCPDLFGPGADKTTFRIFDFCQNLEFFGQDPATKETPIGRSLTERLFDSRVALIQRLEQDLAPPADGAQEEGDNFEPHPDAAPSLDRIVADTRKQLQDAVSSMNLDNFVVRTERRLVEKYQIETSWGVLDEAAADELGQIAGLPNSLAGEREEAKRFDLLVLSLQLALLNGEARFDRLQRQLIEIAAALEVRASVPAIKQHIHLIENVQTDGWWEGVTVPLLELVRRRLRHVVHLIDRTDRTILYSDFEDDLEATTHHKLPGTSGVDLDSVRRKARAFLREHEDNIALAKVRRGAELTGTDLLALEKMLVEAGIATHEDVERAAAAANGFANFIRSLVGMDRDAAQTLFADFLDERATANQIEFVDMIVKHLTENGTMKASAIYDSPFKEIAPLGPEEIFQEADVEDLLSRIRLTSAQKGRQNG